MSRREAEERVNRANAALEVSLEAVRSGCRDTLTGLVDRVNRADPFFIRYVTGSREFQTMRNTLREYANLQELIRPEEQGFRERRAQMEALAKKLLTDAGQYIQHKNNEGRNRNEKRRLAAATEVLNFARQQLRELTQMENLLEDIADAGIQLGQEENPEENQAEAVENQQEAMENQAEAVENQQEAMENQAEAVENQQEEEENQAEAAENQQEAEENQAEAVENQAEPVENQQEEEENQAEAVENQVEQPENDIEENPEEELQEDILDDAGLDAVFREDFYVNSKRKLERKLLDSNDCIKSIIRALRDFFNPQERTYERLGLVQHYDSEEPLNPQEKELAGKLLENLTMREILLKEQEPRLEDEEAEPSLLEIMAAEMEPSDFMTLVTKAPSFQKELEGMTHAGIYTFVAEEDNAALKNLAEKVRIEMPGIARELLFELGERSGKQQGKNPENAPAEKKAAMTGKKSLSKP